MLGPHLWVGRAKIPAPNLSPLPKTWETSPAKKGVRKILIILEWIRCTWWRMTRSSFFCTCWVTFHSKGCCHFSQNYTGDRCACRCNIAPPQLWFCRRHFVKKGIGKKSCFEISCFEISLLMFRKQQFCFEKQHSFNFESCLVASTKSLRNFFVKQTKGCCSLKIIVSFQKPYKFSFQNPFSTNFSNLVLPSESVVFWSKQNFSVCHFSTLSRLTFDFQVSSWFQIFSGLTF